MTQCFSPRWFGADGVSVASTARLPEPGRYNDYGRLSALGCGRRYPDKSSRLTMGAMEPPIVHTLVPPGKKAGFSPPQFPAPNATPAQLPKALTRCRSQPMIFV